MVTRGTPGQFDDALDEDEYQRKRTGKQASVKETESSSRVTFDPPLYIQRYAKVCEVCRKHDIRRVADLGCAELTLEAYLKATGTITEINSVDIDRDILQRCAYRIRPLIADRISPRKESLMVRVLHGSVLDPDPRLLNLDCIIAIELIEHLQPHQVQPFSRNIFGNLKPHHVLISTPNSDFNTLFELTPGHFRHWDHKFEWSQAEFKEYCEGIETRFGYSVERFGVGDPPTPEYGYCSQFAFFTRRRGRDEDKVETENDSEVSPKTYYDEVYEVVEEFNYPVADPNISPEDKLQDALSYEIRGIAMDEYYDEGYDSSTIPLSRLMDLPAIRQFEPTLEQMMRLVRGCELVIEVSDGGVPCEGDVRVEKVSEMGPYIRTNNLELVEPPESEKESESEEMEEEGAEGGHYVLDDNECWG